MNKEIEELIKTDSPWHDPSNNEWFEEDGSLSMILDAMRESLFQPPKLYYTLRREFFERIIKNPSEYGIIILRGPRRIGKTSTIKYIIKELIQSNQVQRENIVYLSLDKDELFVTDGNKKRFLRQLLKEIIKTYKKETQPLFIVLDEVTFYEGWARAIKNIVDEGLVNKGIGIIATGSYSLDLSSAKREISGRWGPVGDKLGGDIFFFPRRFIEVAESLMRSKFNDFLARTIGNYPKRAGILEYLAGYQTEEDNLNFNYSEMLTELLDEYYEDLHGIFETIYIYSGGYPKSIYEAINSQRETGETLISDARYIADLYNLLVTDSKKFRLSEDVVEALLSKIIFPSSEISENYFSVQNLKTKDIGKYKAYLEESGLFMFLPEIRRSDMDIGNQIVSMNTKNKVKLVVTDPAAYIACYNCTRKVKSGLLSKSIYHFNNKTNVRELLFESILISHMAKSSTLNQPIMQKNIGYLTNGQEELADAFVWLLNYEDKFIMFAVEAKSGRLDLSKLKAKAHLARKEFGIERLIIVANCNYIKIEETYSIIPLELFLLLLG